MIKKIIILIAVFGFAGIAFALPTTQLTYQQTLIPGADNSYDLGTSTARWRNLYVSGTCIGCNLGSSTSTNPLMATYYVATSTSQPSEFPYASTTALSSSGSAYFATSAGNVGVGTTTPWGKLSVHQGAGEVGFAVGSSTRTTFAIDANGFVGIGTPSPSNHLTILGFGASAATLDAGIKLHTPNTGSLSTDGFNFGVENSTQDVYINQRENADMRFWLNGGEKVTFKASGNVGIGTTTPGVRLDVLSSASSVARFISTAASGPAVGSGLLIVNNDGAAMASGDQLGTVYFGGAEDAANTFHYGAAVAGYTTQAWTASANGTSLAFETTANGATSRTQRMVIGQDGNVGIGTTSPQVLLQVAKSQDAATAVHISNVNTGTAARSVLGLCQNDNCIGGNYGLLEHFSSGWTTSGVRVADRTTLIGFDTGGLAIGTGAATNLILATNNLERVTIDSSGNVGIGTTSPSTRFMVGSTTAAFASTFSTFTDVTVNSGYTSSSFIGLNKSASASTGGASLGLYSDDGAAMASGDRLGVLVFGGNDGATTLRNGAAINALTEGTWTSSSIPTALTFETAPSASVTRSERMRITAAGNVGIGTTSPTQKLHIADSSAGALIRVTGAANKQAGFILDDAAGDGFSFAHDLFNTGAHNFGIYDRENAAARLLIDSSGNVGIGTTTPTGKLTVHQTSAAAATGLSIEASSASTALINDYGTLVLTNYNQTANNYSAIDFTDNSTDNLNLRIAGIYTAHGATRTGDLAVLTGDGTGSGITERFRIVGSTGNVGIGTTTPGAKLDVTQAANGFSLLFGADVSADSRTNATRKFARIGMPHYTNSEEPVGLFFGDSDGTDNILSFGGSSSFANTATVVRFYTAANNTTTTGTERMRITAAGNVGIGSTTPNSKFVVSTGANTDWQLANVSSYNVMSFNGNTGTGGQRIFGGNTTDTNFYFENGGTTDIIWRMGSSLTERLRLTNAGNVGIGTANPAGYKLNVTGGQVRIQQASGSAPYLDFFQASVKQWGLINPANTTRFSIIEDSTDERLTVAQGGNVGIGTTSPQGRLHVTEGFGGLPYSAGGTPALMVEDSAITTTQFMTGANSEIRLFFGDSGSAVAGRLIYSNNATAASEQFSFGAGGGEDQFVIKGSGNVGIGTTTPPSKLTVNGHIGTDGAIPSVSACGTGPAITVGSTDTAGEVTEGTLSTGCVITFASAYARAPFCTVTSEAGLAFSYTVSASAITITNIGALSSTAATYICVANDL